MFTDNGIFPLLITIERIAKPFIAIYSIYRLLLTRNLTRDHVRIDMLMTVRRADNCSYNWAENQHKLSASCVGVNRAGTSSTTYQRKVAQDQKCIMKHDLENVFLHVQNFE